MEEEIIDTLKGLMRELQGFKQDIKKRFDSLESQVLENTHIIKRVK